MTPSALELRQVGILSPLDAQLAFALSTLEPPADPLVVLATALASRHTRQGHVCVHLAKLAGSPIVNDLGQPLASWRYPDLAPWLDSLRQSRLTSNGARPAPLILDAQGRLYLRRFWQYEQRLAANLVSRARAEAPTPEAAAGLQQALRRLFGPPTAGEPDWQRVCAMLAALQRLCIVTGGPGTGKTSTVVRILALLLEHLTSVLQRKPRTLLLAPTGKAAARLAESVDRAKIGLDCPDFVRELIPNEASTIHRALGPLPATLTRFRHSASEPLIVDVVVIDEASMVDAAMMSRLVDAIPQSARLLLLGDAEQLASVEAGAVLADLSANENTNRFSVELARRIDRTFAEPLPAANVIERPQGLSDCVVQLTKSHRFGEQTSLGQLAAAIRAGSADEALRLLRSAADLELCVEPVPNTKLQAAIRRGFGPVLAATTVEVALERLARFRLLCAHREGKAGVEGLNALVEDTLTSAARARPGDSWLRGRPILITKNDYRLGVFNGDVGLLWPDETAAIRAYFPESGGGIRALPRSRLPAHETAFCMSVHKSQGSEFDEIVVVLPDDGSPLLSRELLYTAITRARLRCRVFGSEQAVRAAVSRRVERASGLRDTLAEMLRGRAQSKQGG